MITLKKKFKIAIIAHRGFSKEYPENTLLAFEKAIEAGADYVELDIHLTKDGELIVSHDKNTKRCGNKELLIPEATVEELKTVDLGMEQTLPTLDEVFSFCKGKIGVQIEIKHEGIAEKLVELIKKHEIENEVLISSFVHSELKKLKEISPNLPVAVLEPTSSNAFKSIFSRKIFIKDAREVKAEGIHPFHKLVNKKLMNYAKKEGLFVNPWTIDDPSVWNKLISLGVSGIITNNPEALYKYLEGGE